MEKFEHRVTKLEAESAYIRQSLEEIKHDLKPIRKHVILLDGLFKFSTSALVVFIVKKMLGW